GPDSEERCGVVDQAVGWDSDRVEVRMKSSKPSGHTHPRLELSHLPQLQANHFLQQQPVLTRVVAQRGAQASVGEDAVGKNFTLRVKQEVWLYELGIGTQLRPTQMFE